MTLIRKDVLNLAFPILTEQIFVMSLGMINTMMAGHIGKEAVSAIGMVDSINNIFIAFFSALAVGGTVVVAQYIGQGNVKKANEAMKQALYAGFAISFIITILTWVFREPLIALLYGSADSKVIHNAYTYLGITLLTYPLISIDLIANGILRGAGDTKTPMKISIFMNFINVVLSYIFIYGIDMRKFNLGLHISGKGITGAAMGIAIARITGAFIVIFILLRGSKTLRLTKLRAFKINKEILKPIFGIGIPASIESLLFNGGKLITQIYIVDMGTVAIASNTVANSIASMMNVPGNSLCIAATALIGQYMGKGDKNEAKSCLAYLTVLATVCVTAVGSIVFPFARVLSSLYTKNQDIICLSANVIKVNCLCIIIWPISFVLSAGLKGAGDAKYTMVTSIIGMWVFRITLGYILGISLGIGLVGVWMGMYADWLVRGVLYCFRFKNGKWMNHIIIKNT